MRNSFFQRSLEWVYDTFKNDTSKMLIATGTLGWILSSAAQIGAIFSNSKISAEKKSFLLPQEFMDAVVNIVAFLGFTTVTKKCIAKMAATGKIAPKSVREFLNNNSLYKKQVGKLDFNLDDVLKKYPENKEIYENYKSYKNFATTMGTIGASILSCNIITPIVRNYTASKVQNTYKDIKKNPTSYNILQGSMKV
jgi:hypothetical protein